MRRSATEVSTLRDIELPRSATDYYWNQKSSYLFNAMYDRDDEMRPLLQAKAREMQVEVKNITPDIFEDGSVHRNQQSTEIVVLKDVIPNDVYEEWDKLVDKNEALKRDLISGKINERRLRTEFKVSEDNQKECVWVGQYLMSKEPDNTFPMPILSSWEDLIEKFGDAKKIKPGAPAYWQDEVSKGRGESARLIKVGVEIPAIWEINDADQSITADLYIGFNWKVKAKKQDIWNKISREFTAPIWKVRLRKGKFITNLKNCDIFEDEIYCKEEVNGVTTIIQRITMTANFSQHFDMHKFPFDFQTIAFTIRYWLDDYKTTAGTKRGRLIFYEDINWACRVKENALKPSDEWLIIKKDSNDTRDMLDFVSKLTAEKFDPSKLKRRWPEINFSFRIKRIPEFMKWNIAVPVTLTLGFGLGGNLTAIDSDFDRTAFTAALLFTIFSIKSNVQHALSKVGYRTTLDSYILLSQAMVILEGAVGVYFTHAENDGTYNLPSIFGGLGLICWGIITYRFWNGKNLLVYCC